MIHSAHEYVRHKCKCKRSGNRNPWPYLHLPQCKVRKQRNHRKCWQEHKINCNCRIIRECHKYLKHHIIKIMQWTCIKIIPIISVRRTKPVRLHSIHAFFKCYGINKVWHSIAAVVWHRILQVKILHIHKYVHQYAGKHQHNNNSDNIFVYLLNETFHSDLRAVLI